jgi:hypothetical protein
MLMEARMSLVRNIRCLLLAAAGIIFPSALFADEHDGRWVSHPRALIMIVIGDDGGRISGPEWEHTFAATANAMDFEIAPGRRLVLRRAGEGWAGEYFHPRTRPGEHPHEAHSMLFVREKVAAR